MAFTLIGPGLRDLVPFETLTPHQQVTPVEAERKAGEEKSSQQGHSISQRAHQAYQQIATPAYERKPAILAEQIMKSPVTTLVATASILDAWQLFRQTRFRHIPVVDSGQVVGLLADRDLLRHAALSGHRPPYDQASPEAALGIEPLITRPVLTASPDTPIRDIARIMIDQRKSVMPIVDARGTLLGVITRSDILRTIVNEAPLELWV